MADLEKRRAALKATIEAAERAQKARPLLHPDMRKKYVEWVIEAKAGLSDESRRAGSVEALRTS